MVNLETFKAWPLWRKILLVIALTMVAAGTIGKIYLFAVKHGPVGEKVINFEYRLVATDEEAHLIEKMPNAAGGEVPTVKKPFLIPSDFMATKLIKVVNPQDEHEVAFTVLGTPSEPAAARIKSHPGGDIVLLFNGTIVVVAPIAEFLEGGDAFLFSDKEESIAQAFKDQFDKQAASKK